MSRRSLIKEHSSLDESRNAGEGGTTASESGSGTPSSSAVQLPPRSIQPRPESQDSYMAGDSRLLESEDLNRRSYGMRNILNPSQQNMAEVSRYQPPAPAAEGLYRPNPTLPSPTQVSIKQSPILHGRASPLPGVSGNRRILTPRSPSVRAASFGGPRGLLPNTEASMSLPMPNRTSEPQMTPRSESSTSPQSAGPRPAFALPPMTESMPGGHPTGSSESHSSPGPAHMPLSQYRSQPPDPYRFGGPPPSTPFPPTLPSPFGGSAASTHQHSASAPDFTTDTGSRTRQMYLETAQGRIGIEVEVDTQAASRMADEKRRRNAGASARFRQRRKEKEREASHTISSLESDLKAIATERDFYLAERNYFREIASRYTQIPPRPTSPRHIRPPPSVSDSLNWQGSSSDPDTQTRHQRRRTSLQGGSLPAPISAGSMSGRPPTLPPPPQIAPGPPQPVYPAPSHYQPPPQAGSLSAGATAPPQHVPHHASHHHQQQQQQQQQQPPPPPLPPSSMPLPPRTLPYDALRPQEPYDRSWNPGR